MTRLPERRGDHDLTSVQLKVVTVAKLPKGVNGPRSQTPWDARIIISLITA
ncbi:MAG: hypothetical protein WBP81_25940 [Solirubrobacteraceae bacterium]